MSDSDPGADTVVFLVETPGDPDRLGVPATVLTPTTVTGCSMQPLVVDDTVTDADLSAAMWRCIAPASAPLMSPPDKIQFQGDTYRVQGTKPFYDDLGVLDHFTVICKEENPD